LVKQLRAALAALTFTIALAAPTAANAQTYWQCAPFARVFSGIQLFGAAAGWWRQAIGKYAQGEAPKLGSVLVFKAICAMRSGHVATVTKIVSDRIIKVTHANWGGAKGRVERDVTVVDASPRGDWSQVKVWYSPIGDIGTRAYPTYGFIYNGAKAVAAEAVAASSAIGAKDAGIGG
jgi:surface antigen